jgi:hypothetical protein
MSHRQGVLSQRLWTEAQFAQPANLCGLQLFVASCLLNQLLPPVNAPSDRADPGKCHQRALCGS